MGALELEATFPRLRSTPYRITSPETKQYNCIAWAAGESSRWWWPSPDAYWPPSAPEALTLDAFVAAYGSCGYSVCSNGDLEPGTEKIAIYATIAGTPKHAARQLTNGNWTSKCGSTEDIEHTLDGVSGVVYGTPAVFMSRTRLKAD